MNRTNRKKTEVQTHSQHLTVKLKDLQSWDQNPRSDAKDTTLTDLAASIKEKGIVQDILVRTSPEEGKHLIVAGERRYLACLMNVEAGHMSMDHEITVKHLGTITDQEALEIAVIENEQREDMNPADRIVMYHKMHQQGSSEQRIADLFGVNVEEVRKSVTIGSRCSDDLLAAIRNGKVSLRSAFFIVSASTQQMRDKMLELVVMNGYTEHALKQVIKGSEIPVETAIFPIEEYTGEINEPFIGDLPSTFVDREQFFLLQSAHAEKKRQELAETYQWAKLVEGDGHFYASQYNLRYHVGAEPAESGVVVYLNTSSGEVKSYGPMQLENPHPQATLQAETPAQNPEPEPLKPAALPEKAKLYPYMVRSNLIQEQLQRNKRESETLLILGLSGWTHMRLKVDDRPERGVAETPTMLQTFEKLSPTADLLGLQPPTLKGGALNAVPDKHPRTVRPDVYLNLYQHLWSLSESEFNQLYCEVVSTLFSDFPTADPLMQTLHDKNNLTEQTYFTLCSEYLKLLNRQQIWDMVQDMPVKIHLHLSMKRDEMVSLILQYAPRLKDAGWMPEGFKVAGPEPVDTVVLDNAAD
ncbi:ParB/RepB/Spo0J family partition protein [Deinococcus roseus]|uniref:ParB-like N-terminal domain-containing protein n=1 Tax=Deinococcus roseus TaxID=392414 RepID=A0ABQ2DGC4_9DEIO|nr:ParB/RepB/Spo0J family partition protein [Deinococcus roseus]GGJ55651.1 hypothetical protein GCM10008938_47280 [Deinococcus roseus]